MQGKVSSEIVFIIFEIRFAKQVTVFFAVTCFFTIRQKTSENQLFYMFITLLNYHGECEKHRKKSRILIEV